MVEDRGPQLGTPDPGLQNRVWNARLAITTKVAEFQNLNSQFPDSESSRARPACLFVEEAVLDAVKKRLPGCLHDVLGDADGTPLVLAIG